MNHIERLSTAISEIEAERSFPFLITDLTNIRYLTGFEGSSASLLLCGTQSYFISDARYSEYAMSILPSSVEFVLQKGSMPEILHGLINKIKSKKLYVENHGLSLDLFLMLQANLKGCRVHASESVIERLRMVKDEEEINLLKKAASITDRCFKHLLGIIREGISEWDISVEVEHFYRTNGCRSTSFETIAASGKGSSMPHYQTSMNKKIKHGEPVLIDMGCCYKGYNSDLTRTVFVGKVDPLLAKIYAIVREAQQTAIDRLAEGITAAELDTAARNVISARGYGDFFGHSLGHGVGLDIHELPTIRTNSGSVLTKNMTITVEPGIYIPGKGGVRIEDMVLVAENGCEVLTRSPKKMTII